ncbi:MAG: glycosyltransferase family 4 protein [Bacteroidales bacterium]|jgi:glycosyltransferase involved in cell wall biosynthesis|nr:glycosyltransferase family 4 protein [Bacteroidales bacterium]
MSNSKKLLLVASGISIHTHNFIELIGGYFSDILLITDYDNKEFISINKYIVDYSFHNPLKILLAIIKIKKVLREFKPDFIIHYQIDTGSFLCSLLQKRNIPTLVVGIGSDVLVNPQKGLFYKLMVKLVLKQGDYFNAGSQELANEMKKLANRPIEVVIANLGINGIEPRKKQNIVFSNRLHSPLYRIDKIIEAFARFVSKKEYADWQLIIAASGNEDALQQQVEVLGLSEKVKFTGWLSMEKNAYYYSISRLWVSIPESDSISISLLEAMSAECIPIVSDLPSMKNFIVNEINGIVVKNIESNFMEKALQLDYEKLKVQNRTLALNFGSKEVNRQKFYAIFEKAFNL